LSRLLVVIHQDDAGRGVFGRAVASSGWEEVEWRPHLDPGPAPGSVDAALVLGGAVHPHQEEQHPWLRGEKALIAELLARGTPTMGVCLGAELVAEVAGAPPARLASPEIGWLGVRLQPAAAADPVLGALPDAFTAFQWHSYAAGLPSGAAELARGAGGPDAFRLGDAWGIQFHAEVSEAIIESWLADHENDPDAVAAGFDPEVVRRQTPDRIAASERLGEVLFGAFLDFARSGAATRA
jgi:GMP synthase (glutamine-hydrolysing)